MPRNTKGIEVAEIIADQCIGCQICTAECPVGAIEMVEGTAVIDPEECIGCGKCAEVCPVKAIRFEKKRRAKKAREVRARVTDEFPEHSGVAVFIEASNGHAAQVSWELAGKARQLAGQLDTKVIGLLLGYQVETIAREAVLFGCDDVYVIDDPLLQQYLSLPYGKALSTLCQHVKPEIVLIGATALGRDLASIASTQLQTGLTADCTALDIEEETGLLLMTRPTFGGNIMATIFCEHHRPQMSTVRPHVMKLHENQPNRTGNVHAVPWVAPTENIPTIVESIPTPRALDGIDIAQAPALVVAGKGACSPDAIPLLQELADLVGGVVACSRPVVEAGLMPYERQVGQTGKTVAPKLYVAVGVAGAVQHLVGMQGSEKIVAINSDPEAPIFKVADAALIGDYVKVVPALIAGLKNRMAIHQ